VVLAVVMFSTASLDWSGQGNAKPLAASSDKNAA